MDPEGVSGPYIKSTSIVSPVDYYCRLYEAYPDALSLKNCVQIKYNKKGKALMVCPWVFF